jgi:hypothetical protein
MHWPVPLQAPPRHDVPKPRLVYEHLLPVQEADWQDVGSQTQLPDELLLAALDELLPPVVLDELLLVDELVLVLVGTHTPWSSHIPPVPQGDPVVFIKVWHMPWTHWTE